MCVYIETLRKVDNDNTKRKKERQGLVYHVIQTIFSFTCAIVSLNYAVSLNEIS